MYGQKTKVKTDHKPLEIIFKKDSCKVPKRLQRILLQLQEYNLDVEWIPGKQMHIADHLSRSNNQTVLKKQNLMDKSIIHQIDDIETVNSISETSIPEYHI